MFGKLKSMTKLSEASGIVEDAIRRTSPFGPEFDVKTLSSRLVAMLYSTKPDLFDGKMGQRPHPLATAAASLAQGLKQRPQGFSEDVDASMFLALGSLLQSASANSQTYRFGGYDVPLLKVSEQSYWEHEAKTREATDKIVGSLGL